MRQLEAERKHFHDQEEAGLYATSNQTMQVLGEQRIASHYRQEAGLYEGFGWTGHRPLGEDRRTRVNREAQITPPDRIQSPTD